MYKTWSIPLLWAFFGFLSGLFGILMGMKRPRAALVVVLFALMAAAVAFFTATHAPVRDGAGAVVPMPMTVIVPPGGTWPTTHPAEPTGKEWVDDWVGFVNYSQEGRRRLRAESPVYCATEEEARQEARSAAVELLLPSVKSQMNSRAARSNGTSVKVDDQWLRQQITSSLDTIVADRHVRRIARPYGDVWHEQVLIDASKPTMDKLVNTYSAAARVQFETTRSTWLTMGALVGVIVLLYAFLNAATKGYFVWRLRAAALLLTIAAVLVLLALT